MITRAVLAGTVLCAMAGSVFAACTETRVSLRGDWGRAQFSVEIADDLAEQQLGLMHRPTLARSAGMLFLYDEPGPLAFWMRNTLIELDMIFIDPAGVVAHVHHRAQPLDETPIPGGDGLQAVLEINGGLAKRLGIDVGSEIQHPFFGADAAWPCAEE